MTDDEIISRGDSIFGPSFNHSACARARVLEFARAIEAATLERAASLCDRFAARDMHPAECAAAIRAMKGKEE
jgi:hypothetical protein